MCPQHDVLWLELTVAEHLQIFARLRAIPAERIPAEVDQKLRDVGLTEKRFTKAHELSGGQKRKLSLCLALVGESKVVFLDEPTSGMDPYSRRSTWNMLQNSRDGKTMILTTHFMDEADLLGDRIAIMAEGTLQCCGSSLYLKSQYGTGYHLTIATKREKVVGSEPVVALVKSHVKAALLLTDVGAEISFQLPKEVAATFPAMFEDLDAQSEALEIEEYGISQVTLEEVFLKVASGSESKQHAFEAPSTEAALSFMDENLTQRDQSLFCRHFVALLKKRLHYGRRDYKSIVCVSILPVFLLIGGLLLLKYAGNPAQPDFAMDLRIFEEDPVPVPFYAAPHAAPGLDHALGRVLGVEPVAVELTMRPSNGSTFGVSYNSGTPCQITCDNPLEQKSIYGHYAQCDNLFTQFKNAKQAGINLGCTTDQASCKAAISGACATNGAACSRSCLGQPGGNSQICDQFCTKLCAKDPKTGTTDLSAVCLMYAPLVWIGKFTHPTTANLCPMTCGACPAGSPCEGETIEHMPTVEPEAILEMSQAVYTESFGSSRADARYGAIIFHPNNSQASVSATVLHNTTCRHAVPTFVNLLDSALCERYRPGTTITVKAAMPDRPPPVPLRGAAAL